MVNDIRMFLTISKCDSDDPVGLMVMTVGYKSHGHGFNAGLNLYFYPKF